MHRFSSLFSARFSYTQYSASAASLHTGYTTPASVILVPAMNNLNIWIRIEYGRSDKYRLFAIQSFDRCVHVLHPENMYLPATPTPPTWMIVPLAPIFLSSSWSLEQFKPLGGASRLGHEVVVKLLRAGDDLNPDKPDNKSKTLHRSPWSNGHEMVVRLLLMGDDFNPNKPDNIVKTPLWGAARQRHEGVVNLQFTRHDVNPGKPDKWSYWLIYPTKG